MILDPGPRPGFLPNHKQSVLLFLDRVYGIDSQEMLFHFLEKSFLPDLRASTMMDSVSYINILIYLCSTFSLKLNLRTLFSIFQPKAVESDTALALNRYLCNAVLPLLTNHSSFFSDAEHHAALLDATLHTVLFIDK